MRESKGLEQFPHLPRRLADEAMQRGVDIGAGFRIGVLLEPFGARFDT